MYSSWYISVFSSVSIFIPFTIKFPSSFNYYRKRWRSLLKETQKWNVLWSRNNPFLELVPELNSEFKAPSAWNLPQISSCRLIFKNKHIQMVHYSNQHGELTQPSSSLVSPRPPAPTEIAERLIWTQTWSSPESKNTVDSRELTTKAITPQTECAA